MGSYRVHKFYRFWALFSAVVLLSGRAGADEITLHPKNGQPITGEPIEETDAGIRLKLSDPSLENPYMAKPLPWGTLTQEDLQALYQQFQTNQNPRVQAAAKLVEPFLQLQGADKIQKTDIGTLKDVPRLERPSGQSFFAALATSSAGLLMLLLLYGGNLYAAYVIAIFRAQPAGLVCGLAAVLPILGPAIFLAMPRREPRSVTEMYEIPNENLEAAIAAEQAEVAPAATQAHGAPRHPTTQGVAAAPGTLPAGKTFARGQFTFNRRFFETQMPGFFAVVRPMADKDMQLIFKTARGTFIAERISRITPNEAYITVRKGHASEEIHVPFNDIQEVQLKHKDA